MDVFDWIVAELKPTESSSDAAIYDHMDSQSGFALPIIYQPFDAADREHWRDRGAVYDFLLSCRAVGMRVLDFGPGDGWPSLIVAPFVREVVGVDASARRVEVCAANAERLGITNAHFVRAPLGEALPFEDGSFDAVMAASSVEQSPDPYATLCELYRVLRPGGRLRMHYEALGCYRGEAERAVWLDASSVDGCRLILYDRDIAAESVRQVVFHYRMPCAELRAALGGEGAELPFAAITVTALERLRPALAEAQLWTTRHPSGRTLAGWLRDIGFTEVLATHSAIRGAGWLFDALTPSTRPTDLAGVDAWVRPLAEVILNLAAPLKLDPPLTAVKG